MTTIVIIGLASLVIVTNILIVRHFANKYANALGDVRKLEQRSADQSVEIALTRSELVDTRVRMHSLEELLKRERAARQVAETKALEYAKLLADRPEQLSDAINYELRKLLGRKDGNGN